jgi:hypothetical protein
MSPQDDSRFNGSDLLSSFLLCVMAFEDQLSQLSSISEHAKRAFKWTRTDGQQKIEDLQLIKPEELSHAMALAILPPEASDALTSATCKSLWATLQNTLRQIEPFCQSRGEKIIPRSLDHAWHLIEASEIDLEDESGRSGKSGASKRL